MRVIEPIFVTMCMSALPTEVGGVLTALSGATGADNIDEVVDEVEGLLEGTES